MEHEAVAVRGENERDVEGGGVVEALLHPVADAIRVVFGLDQRQRDVGLVIEHVVGALRLAAADQLAADDDAALGEADLFPDLRHHIPSRPAHGRRDELCADVTFAEASFIYAGIRNSDALLATEVLQLTKRGHSTKGRSSLLRPAPGRKARPGPQPRCPRYNLKRIYRGSGALTKARRRLITCAYSARCSGATPGLPDSSVPARGDTTPDPEDPPGRMLADNWVPSAHPMSAVGGRSRHRPDSSACATYNSACATYNSACATYNSARATYNNRSTEPIPFKLIATFGSKVY